MSMYGRLMRTSASNSSGAWHSGAAIRNADVNWLLSRASICAGPPDSPLRRHVQRKRAGGRLDADALRLQRRDERVHGPALHLRRRVEVVLPVTGGHRGQQEARRRPRAAAPYRRAVVGRTPRGARDRAGGVAALLDAEPQRLQRPHEHEGVVADLQVGQRRDALGERAEQQHSIRDALGARYDDRRGQRPLDRRDCLLLCVRHASRLGAPDCPTHSRARMSSLIVRNAMAACKGKLAPAVDRTRRLDRNRCRGYTCANSRGVIQQ